VFGVCVRLGQVRKLLQDVIDTVGPFNQESARALVSSLQQNASLTEKKKAGGFELKIAHWLRESYMGLSTVVVQKLFINEQWKVLAWNETLNFLKEINTQKQIHLAEILLAGCKEISADPVNELARIFALESR
jgi:hypothetical protein